MNVEKYFIDFKGIRKGALIFVANLRSAWYNICQLGSLAPRPESES